MALTIQDVESVAALARLALTEQETEALRDQLSAILGHIAVLETVDTESISPTASVIPLTNVMRDDVIQQSLPRDVALANAPRQANGFFEVSAVLGGDPAESA